MGHSSSRKDTELASVDGHAGEVRALCATCPEHEAACAVETDEPQNLMVQRSNARVRIGPLD